MFRLPALLLVLLAAPVAAHAAAPPSSQTDDAPPASPGKGSAPITPQRTGDATVAPQLTGDAPGPSRRSDELPPASPRASRVEAKVASAIAESAAGWERVKRASEAFLGTPYRHSPLGEGAGVDADPRLRFDAVDCLTLIETAIAAGEARTPSEIEPILDDVRYADGTAPAFANRLHLMEAQWIPDLVRKGYLEEATVRLGGGAVVEESIAYDEKEWRARKKLRGLPWQPSLAGTHLVPYIPLADAARLAPTLPEGLVINVVRAPVPGAVSLVTHSGLLVIKDGKRYVRHAALRQAQVIDEPLEHFIARHAQMRLRKVLGLNLLAVRSNAVRAEKAVAARRLVTGR